ITHEARWDKTRKQRCDTSPKRKRGSALHQPSLALRAGVEGFGARSLALRHRKKGAARHSSRPRAYWVPQGTTRPCSLRTTKATNHGHTILAAKDDAHQDRKPERACRRHRRQHGRPAGRARAGPAL